ncbi:MAG: glycosyltransferase family 4 protein [Acutalibacteraceae bacterium]
MKKALMNSSVASMIYKFNMNNMETLEKLGYQVDVACNFGKENPISEKEISDFRNILNKKNIRIFETTCPRSIFAFKNMIGAYKQLKSIAESEHYDLVHTQSPIGGVVCRLAFRGARKSGTKVIYQAHGFHFYKGAPLINKIIFYPIEKFCAHFTDALITINKEDFALAKAKMKAKKIFYVPGVGINLEKFGSKEENGESEIISKLRRSLACSENELLILSVGELNENKNHALVLKALAEAAKKDESFRFQYAIAGKGEKESELKTLADSLSIGDSVHLLGFREDMEDLYKAADVFVFPSFREGLAVSVMEAMAMGLPCLVSEIRGNVDLIDNGEGGWWFDPNDAEALSKLLLRVQDETLREKFASHNREKIKQFSVPEVQKAMEAIYKEIGGDE